MARTSNMDRECEDADENTPLISETDCDRITSDLTANCVVGGTSLIDTIVFDSKMMKTSTQTEDLAATWGGHRSMGDSSSGRLRRVHSWSAGPPDQGSSEIRILRERLVRTQTRLQPGAVRHLSRRQKLTLASLALVDFMSFCSMSVMAPFFPREAANKGLSEAMCGVVFSFYAVVMFVTSPVFGKFLPVVGAKFLFIAGMFLAGGCNVIFGTLALIQDTFTFTTLCFVVRGLEALGASAYSTASYVFVVNAFPDSIGSVLGILETFIGLGMSVGPAIGGILYSIGGFGLPFYTLGVIMVLTVPINFFLLTDCEEYVSGSKTASIFSLFKIPSIIITGLVIVIVSNTWAFLDPTLEPHMRQFGLSAEEIGLIFLLFSSLYGIFSPIWGWVADRVHNHWCMMVWGLFLSTAGLLLLGPCPYIPGLPRALWLDLVALSILGISVALTLLPTFQGVLTSSIDEGGCPEALATYSAVAGVWSCCYSLGEVLGPALGGALTQEYGFPLCATLCAAACFTMAVVTLTFFCLRESRKCTNSTGSACESIPYTDTTWNSTNFCRTRSAPQALAENSPLLTPCSCYNHSFIYGTAPPKHFCLTHNKSNKSGSASVTDVIAYILKFEFVINTYIRIRRSRKKSIACPISAQNQLYQNYLDQKNEKIEDNGHLPSEKSNFLSENGHVPSENGHIHSENGHIPLQNGQVPSDNGHKTTETVPRKNGLIVKNDINRPAKNKSSDYCSYLEDAIFGSADFMKSVTMDNLKVKRHNKGLVSMGMACEDERSNTDEIIKHNIEKVQFYEQDVCASFEDIFDSCDCRDGVTYARGTVTVSSTGACEV